jgi:hypothetical protein
MNDKLTATFDIEGDGVSNPARDLLFNGLGHYDKNTIPWCATLCFDGQTETHVCKLPSTPRDLGLGYHSAYHKESTRVPEELNGHRITSYNNLSDWLLGLTKSMSDLADRGYELFFKTYYDSRLEFEEYFNYDIKVLCDTANRVSSELEEADGARLKYYFDNMFKSKRAIVPVTNTAYWKYTSEQQSRGTFIDNQAYMLKGIIHNIEDAEQLYHIIQEGKYKRV